MKSKDHEKNNCTNVCFAFWNEVCWLILCNQASQSTTQTIVFFICDKEIVFIFKLFFAICSKCTITQPSDGEVSGPSYIHQLLIELEAETILSKLPWTTTRKVGDTVWQVTRTPNCDLFPSLISNNFLCLLVFGIYLQVYSTKMQTASGQN